MTNRHPKETRLGELVGATAAMRKAFVRIRKAAKVDMPVLITGETGTGKTVAARLVHDLSARKQGPFVAVNAGALPTELIPSRIFGHVRGAFTGATQRQIGGFEEASGGTLFLDEVSTMDEHAQAAFLRVLDTGIFRRIGGKRDIRVDVRVIAATNENLRRAVKEGRFREDLLYRLQVLTINLPPLRAHRTDLSVLVDHFLESFREEFGIKVRDVSHEALALLKAYDWPGNVRELKNVVICGAVMSGEHDITPAALPERITSLSGTGPVALHPGPRSALASTADNGATVSQGQSAGPFTDGVFIPAGTRLDQAEMAIILKTLQACDDNKTRTAQVLGISRKTLYDKLARWRGKDFPPRHEPV